MLSFRSAPLLIPCVSISLSVQVSGWRFSSGIVSESGVSHQTKKSDLNLQKNIPVPNGTTFSQISGKEDNLAKLPQILIFI